MDMPILESCITEFKKDDNIVVLHINHCMDNSFYFCEQLKKLFYEVVFVAAPYNNKEPEKNTKYPYYHAVLDGENYYLKHNGQSVGCVKTDFVGAAYALIELAFNNEIARYVNEGKKIIIIEDGGYHNDIIERLISRNKSLSSAIIGAVEQTTAGTRKARVNERYPVLSVARSVFKTRIESYFIANVVMRDICRLLNSIDVFLDFRQVYILGYGIIGRQLAQKAKECGADVHVCDTDSEIQAVAKSDGFIVHTENDISFQSGSIVIGCAGEPSFTVKMLDSFLKSDAKKIYLASASSKQVEFSAVYQALKENERWSTKYCSGSFFQDDKEVILLADGYPVNFFDVDSVSLTFSMIDIVFAEMALSAIFLKDKHASLLNNKTYLISLSPMIDSFVCEHELIAKWKKIHGLTISNSFNKHPLEQKLKYNSTKKKDTRFAKI